jgi:HAD superfamily hydrolase (TIGR01509 family)
MDGVIVDSAAFHLRSWQEVFSARNIDFSRQDFSRTFGMVNKDIITYKLGSNAAPELVEAIGQQKEEAFRRLVVKDHIQSLPGAVALIEALDGQGVRLGLASSAPRANIELILHMLGLKNCFQAMVGEEDVSRGKPDPQPYLLAAERLGVEAMQSLVIEDAPAGIEAAHLAGMKAIGVATSHSRQELAAADLVVDSAFRTQRG